MKRTYALLLLSLPLWGVHQSIAKSSTENIVAYTIFAEARGEENLGMCHVASVIWNRSIEKNKSPEVICRQRLQFSCWNGVTNPKPNLKRQADKEAWRFCLLLARDIERGSFKPFNNSNHYYNSSKASPSWGSKMQDVFYYNNHKFGRL